MNTNPLIGKTITAIEIAADKLALRFILSNSECVVNVDADCCSHTWIEEVELPALGFPAIVTAVEDLSLDRPDEGEHGDSVIAFYGCKITTDRGEIVIDYRNESNGYYGGSLSWPDDGYRYGGVYGQANSKYDWRALGEVTSTEQDA